MRKILLGSTGAITNNGSVLYYQDGTLPSAYRELTGIVYDGNVYYDTGKKLYGSDTVKLSASATKSCNVFGCYTTAEATTNYSLYFSTASGAKYLRYGDGTYDSRITTNTRYDMTITPTGSSGMRTNSSWSELTFTSATDMLIGTTSEEATTSKFTGTMYGNVEVVGRMVYIPVERISDGEIGYFELNSEVFLENQGTGTPTKLGYAE